MKIECHIIQDLLPLYIDDLTNEKTTLDIRNHFNECNRCQELLNDLKNDQLKNPLQNAINIQEIDYLMKIKRQLTKRSIISAVILSIILIFTIVQYSIGNYNYYITFALLPFFIVLGFISLYDGMKNEYRVGVDFWLANILVFLIVSFTIAFIARGDIWVNDGKFPFGLEDYQVGLFVNRMLWIERILIILVVIYGIVKGFKKSILYYILICNSFSCIAMINSYTVMLKRLNDFNEYEAVRNISIVVYIEGIIITAIIWLYLKRKVINNIKHV